MMMDLPFRAIVFDSDGVITVNREGLPGAAALFRALNRDGFPYRVITNASIIDRQAKAGAYAKAGVAVEAERITGAAAPLARYLQDHPLPAGTRVWAVGREDPAELLSAYGLVLDPEVAPGDCGAVILFDDDFAWDTTRIAHVANLLLQNPDIPLIVPNPDVSYPLKPGYFFPTSGAVARWISDFLAHKGVRVRPVHFGKPYRGLYDIAYDRLCEEVNGLAPADILMVGDTPASDILGANRVGWRTALVKTGNFRYGADNPEAKADYTFSGLPELCRYFSGIMGEAGD